MITKINSKKVDDADDVYDVIGKSKPADKVTITYMRDKKESTTTATLDKNKNHPFVWNSDNDFNKLRLNNSGDFNFQWNENRAWAFGCKTLKQPGRNGNRY